MPSEQRLQHPEQALQGAVKRNSQRAPMGLQRMAAILVVAYWVLVGDDRQKLQFAMVLVRSGKMRLCFLGELIESWHLEKCLCRGSTTIYARWFKIISPQRYFRKDLSFCVIVGDTFLCSFRTQFGANFGLSTTQPNRTKFGSPYLCIWCT